jgi:hypothetical protein
LGINSLFLRALFAASVPLPPTRLEVNPLEQGAEHGGIDDDSVRAIGKRREFEGASGQPLAKETPARAIEPNRSTKAAVTTQEQVQVPVDRLESEPPRRTGKGVERASHVDGRYSDKDTDPGAERQHDETTRSNRSNV